LALLDVKGHTVAFCKRFESGSIDTGVMNEYIRSIFLLDEAVAFFFVEPLYRSIGHNDTLLS